MKINRPLVLASLLGVVVGVLAYSAPPLLAGLFGLFLVVFSAMTGGLAGGVISGIWASAVILPAFILPDAEIGVFELVTFWVAFVGLGVGLGQVFNAMREQQQEIKRITGRLEREKEFASSVIEIQGALLAVLDASGRIVRFNRACEETTGYSSEEVVGRVFWELLLEEQAREKVRCAFETGALKSFPDRYEQFWRCKDGNRRLISWSNSVLTVPGGERHVLAAGFDITERKRTENDLRYQLDFEKRISEILVRIIRSPYYWIDDGLRYGLQSIGEFFNADRSYLFMLSADGAKLRITQEWCAANVEPQIDKVPDFSPEELPWFAQRIRALRPVNIPDINELPEQAEAEREEFSRQNIRSLLCIPLIIDDNFEGFIGLDAVREKREWTDKQVSLLQIIAEIFGVALARHRAEERINHMTYHDQLTGLYNRTFFEEEIQRLDVERMLPLSIIMADVNGLKLVNDTLGHGKGDELLKEAADILCRCCRREDIIARWGGDEYVILLPDTTAEESERIAGRIDQACVSHENDGLPVSIAVGHASKDEPKQDIQDVLKTAEKRMYRKKLTESRSARSAVLEALIKTLGSGGHETEEHMRRLREVAQAMGKKIGLSASELDRLALLVSLHDIGKLNIADEILEKPDRLTDEEWEVLKRHPERGYRIAAETGDFEHVAEDILCHHERWDGGGYPRGLSGEDIPLLSRILAIADAYVTMTGGRSYKEPKTQKNAVEEVKKGAGSQFDPALVEKFVQVVGEGGDS